jgi:hypothetical protein
VNGLRTVGSPTLKRLYEPDWKNFAPRLSFAYNVGGNNKTIVRAGWGVFFDAFQQDLFLGQLPWNSLNPGPAYNGIGARPILFSSSTAAAPDGSILPLSPDTPVFPASSFGATDIFAVNRNLRTPYMENYNVNIHGNSGHMRFCR